VGASPFHCLAPATRPLAPTGAAAPRGAASAELSQTACLDEPRCSCSVEVSTTVEPAQQASLDQFFEKSTRSTSARSPIQALGLRWASPGQHWVNAIFRWVVQSTPPPAPRNSRLLRRRRSPEPRATSALVLLLRQRAARLKHSSLDGPKKAHSHCRGRGPS
jgi:hypothetical protein